MWKALETLSEFDTGGKCKKYAISASLSAKTNGLNWFILRNGAIVVVSV